MVVTRREGDWWRGISDLGRYPSILVFEVRRCGCLGAAVGKLHRRSRGEVAASIRATRVERDKESRGTKSCVW